MQSRKATSSQQVSASSDDEIKDLIDALNRMTANLRATAKVADAIAGGDLTVEAKPLSDKDTLGLALKRMVEKLRVVVSDSLGASANVSSGSQEMSASVRATVVGRHRAGVCRRGGVLVDGADGGQHQAERRQRQARPRRSRASRRPTPSLAARP